MFVVRCVLFAGCWLLLLADICCNVCVVVFCLRLYGVVCCALCCLSFAGGCVLIDGVVDCCHDFLFFAL